MLSGFTVVIIWEIFLKSSMSNIGGLIPGIVANLVVLFSYHYVFKQKGGWVGVKDQVAVDEMQKDRKKN